ncbi:hypothetical protein MILU53160_10600 [Micrococcus luteus]|uniref:hypothetical protein n=1 Tax=Micrococcus sp. 116 TaxID=2653154 RepID=UPI001F2413B0|nr:hypothetical protein [Micrococcus sp. 116]
MTLDDVHVGFLHRVLEDGVLTTRMGFAPTPAQRAARDGLPERYLAQTQVGFTPDGDGWAWTTHEDSAGAQRVRIDRERAGIDAAVLPSYAEYLLLARVAAEGPLAVDRLEEASPLQGGLRVPRAELRPADAGGSDVRVAVVADGVELGAHLVREGAVVASDWGGGTASTPVADQAAATAGLDAHVVTFAGLPIA